MRGIESIKKITLPLARKLDLMISRCVLKLVDNTTPTISAQAEFFDGEIHDGCEVIQQFGFTSVPPKESEAVALFLGGERLSPLIIATEDKETRVQCLKEGEVALYSAAGDRITMTSNQTTQITTQNLHIECGQEMDIKTKKFSLSNDEAELISVLIDLCDSLHSDTTNTLMGPQKLNNAIAGKYEKIKQKLSSFQS